MLTQPEIRHLRDVGYLRIEKVVELPIVKECTTEISSLLKTESLTIATPPSAQYRLENITNRTRLLRELFLRGPVVDIVEMVLGPSLELVLNRHNHATISNSGNPALRIHRDVLNWTRSIVTVILYLEDAAEEDGCTRVIPSSHFWPTSSKPNNGGTWLDEQEGYAILANQLVPVPMRAGSLLIMDGQLFHAAGHNSSGRQRPVVTVAYRAVDELAEIPDKNSLLVRGVRHYKGLPASSKPPIQPEELS